MPSPLPSSQCQLLPCSIAFPQGAIKPLCDLLSCSDARIVTVALEGLENILKVGLGVCCGLAAGVIDLQIQWAFACWICRRYAAGMGSCARVEWPLLRLM